MSSAFAFAGYWFNLTTVASSNYSSLKTRTFLGMPFADTREGVEKESQERIPVFSVITLPVGIRTGESF